MASPESSDAFTIIDTPHSPPYLPLSDPHATSYPHQLFSDYYESYSGKSVDLNVQFTTALRRQYPLHVLDVIAPAGADLLAYAAIGKATAVLDDKTEEVIHIRGYMSSGVRGKPGQLTDYISFAKYNYVWDGAEFIVYVLSNPYKFYYVLRQPTLAGEVDGLKSRISDSLFQTVGDWQHRTEEYVFVFDGFWIRSRQLWEEVQKAKWEDVILDEDMKGTLTDVVGRFFDSKDIYDELGVPWKRGVIFYGPPGNGKTISIKAIMHTLQNRKQPIPSLYVKSAPNTNSIRQIFTVARQLAPCLLILEDVDTIVTQGSRSYFFNEVDGLERNDGILMIASTNHLDQLDPGLSKRPSRFDRKYLFPLPSDHERYLYCEYWRQKLSTNKTTAIPFPEALCPAIASIMTDFSFAYMKEAFIATLLVIAGNRSGDDIAEGPPDDDDELDKYELWREMKKQIKILRGDMDSSNTAKSNSGIQREAPALELPAKRPKEEDHPDQAEPQFTSFPRQLSPRLHREASGSRKGNGTAHSANDGFMPYRVAKKFVNDGIRSGYPDLMDGLAWTE